jgi:hypothetical protein
MVYDGSIEATSSITQLRARAYKEGWFGSEVTGGIFYKTTFKPDSIIMLTLPERRYMAKGAETLMDRESGDVNYGSREGWLGYRNDRMETIVEFKNPVDLQSVTLSTNCDVGGYIFPAKRIRVWGGADKGHTVLLSTLEPDQPDGYISMQKGLACTFKQQPITYLKIVAEPVPTLPSWHSGKGEKGWLFVDEILFN